MRCPGGPRAATWFLDFLARPPRHEPRTRLRDRAFPPLRVIHPAASRWDVTRAMVRRAKLTNSMIFAVSHQRRQPDLKARLQQPRRSRVPSRRTEERAPPHGRRVGTNADQGGHRQLHRALRPAEGRRLRRQARRERVGVRQGAAGGEEEGVRHELRAVGAAPATPVASWRHHHPRHCLPAPAEPGAH